MTRAHAGIDDDDDGVADGTTDVGADITDVDGVGIGTDGVDADTGAVAIAGRLGGVGAGVGIVAGLPVAMPVVKNEKVDKGWIVKSTHSPSLWRQEPRRPRGLRRAYDS